MKNKKMVIIVTCACLSILILIFQMAIKQKQFYTDAKMNVVSSLEDEITENTLWCGTFNLIWNDLKNDLVKQDIKFENQTEIIDNLNKGTFTSSQLNENSYYKTYGKPTLELKKEIEKQIKEKFNEKSDILDGFEWDGSEDNYFLYVMLKKEFNFPKEFSKLESGDFKDKTNVEYFGINEDTKDEVRENVSVLYYKDNNNFAIKLKTKENDEVILSRGNEANNFLDIYKEIVQNEEDYQGSKNLNKDELLKIPNLKLKTKKEFTELEDKEFLFASGEKYYIQKAIQTIEFELNHKGGKIKSEAGMAVNKFSSESSINKREFLFNDTFMIFLKEKESSLPYFAAKISDIENFQENVTKK